MSNKISACLIIRDEASTLEACLDSLAGHVDEIVVVDTGSKDSSPEIAKRMGALVVHWTGCNDEQGRIADFAAARNKSLELATHDWVFWVDGDDVVKEAHRLRELVEQAPDGPVSYLMPYEYAHDKAGRCRVLQVRERLLYPRKDFVWQVPVHEGCLPRPGVVHTSIPTDAVRVIHRAQHSTKPREAKRNLRILEAYQLKMGEGDVRALYYLGQEYLLHGEAGLALQWLRRYTQLSNWSDEKCLALLTMAQIHQALGDQVEAINWALQALVTKSWPEPYFLLGKSMCLLAQRGIEPDYNFRRAVHQFVLGLGMDPRLAYTPLQRDPQEPYEAQAWLAVAMHRLGELDGAISACTMALQGIPEHVDALENMKQFRRERARRNMRSATAEMVELDLLEPMARQLIEHALSAEFKVQRLPDSRPVGVDAPHEGSKNGVAPAVENTGQLARWSRVATSVAGANKLDIVLFIGHGLEPWTPRTLEARGMGGSETMAWEMAKRLAKLGHDVTVFGHCDDEGIRIYDGVQFGDASWFHDVTCDVLICSRNPTAAFAPNVEATATVLWVHDVHCGEMFTPETAARFDMVWCLSQWHRRFFLECYPWLSPGKVEVTRNGIDPARFARTDVVRHPHRAIYSSSPDRGLITAVEAWPAVRGAIPDAELHVYYGFENWRASLKMGWNGHPMCSQEALDTLMIKIATTPGVVLHGRVNGEELAEAMLGASVWCYPTWFSETSCITAMEAQAAGLVCVCPPTAALAETVRNSHATWVKSLLPVDVAEECIHAFHDVPRHSDSGEFYAKNISLDSLAEAWSERLRKLVTDMRTGVMTAFVEAAQ